MKRKQAALTGAVIILVCVAGLALWQWRSKPAAPPPAPVPIYAYADLEHIMMSHPKYAVYHRLDLEYNALIAQYQFEQWNYSAKAAAEGKSLQLQVPTEAAGNAALDQELQAKMALKENELNQGLQQKYQELVQEKKQAQPVISKADNLKIVNLQLKLQNLALSDEEKKATQEELYALLNRADTNVQVTNRTTAEINAAMEPYKEKARQELAAYGKEVKADLEKRKQNRTVSFTQKLDALQDRPDPVVWNKDWKDKLDAKEQELKKVKEEIMADIRDKAAAVAQEQGYDLIFGDYTRNGTAPDVTDDIIAKLA